MADNRRFQVDSFHRHILPRRALRLADQGVLSLKTLWAELAQLRWTAICTVVWGECPETGILTRFPLVFESAIPMSGLRTLFGHHCKSVIDRLQSWASLAWTHDNAIHDLPFDA